MAQPTQPARLHTLDAETRERIRVAHAREMMRLSEYLKVSRTARLVRHISGCQPCIIAGEWETRPDSCAERRALDRLINQATLDIAWWADKTKPLPAAPSTLF